MVEFVLILAGIAATTTANHRSGWKCVIGAKRKKEAQQGTGAHRRNRLGGWRQE